MSAVARTTPPELNDMTQYVRIPDVPILDVHTREHFDQDTGKSWQTSVDADQLSVICENSNARVQSGELGLLFVGHTRRGEPETVQPPLVGFMKDYKVGEYNGEPTILADLYLKSSADLHELGMKPYQYVLSEFPRRSVEIFRKTAPDGYIDALALLKRSPERNLGLLTYNKQEEIEILDCPSDEKEDMASNQQVSSSGTTGDLNADVAIKQLAQKIIEEIAGHEGLHGLLAAKLAPLVIADIKNFLEGVAEGDDDDEGPSDVAGGGEPERQETGAGGMPSATNTTPPAPAGGSKNENENMEKNETPSTAAYAVEIATLKDQNAAKDSLIATQGNEIAELKARLDTIEQFNREQIGKFRKESRLARLDKLAATREFDPNDLIESYANLDDAAFDQQCDMIEKYWKVRSNPVGRPALDLARGVGDPRPVEKSNAGASDGDPLTQDERIRGAVEHYATEQAEKFPQKKGEDIAAYGARLVESFTKLPAEERAKYGRRRRPELNGAAV